MGNKKAIKAILDHIDSKIDQGCSIIGSTRNDKLKDQFCGKVNGLIGIKSFINDHIQIIKVG